MNSNRNTAISPQDVIQVARTGQPITAGERTITIDEVVAMTTPDDWDGTLYQLRYGAAIEIAETLSGMDSVPALPDETGNLKTPELVTG